MPALLLDVKRLIFCILDECMNLFDKDFLPGRASAPEDD
jgi:hypothetical protein